VIGRMHHSGRCGEGTLEKEIDRVIVRHNLITGDLSVRRGEAGGVLRHSLPPGNPLRLEATVRSEGRPRAKQLTPSDPAEESIGEARGRGGGAT